MSIESKLLSTFVGMYRENRKKVLNTLNDTNSKIGIT